MDNSLEQSQTFKKMLMVSVAAHIALVAAFTVKLALFKTEAINYQAAVRVDLIALPDKIDSETVAAPEPQPKEVAVKKSEPSQKEKIKEKPKEKAVDLKKKQTKAIEQLKALQDLEKELEQENKKKKTTQFKGNVLAAGTALRGINKIDYEEYIGAIDTHIKENWVLPEWLASKGLSARVLVKISTSGEVTEKKLIQPSGNSTYDSLVLSAVERSSPFPRPPEKFVNIVGFDGIIFQFP